jgi:hypothetical protein
VWWGVWGRVGVRARARAGAGGGGGARACSCVIDRVHVCEIESHMSVYKVYAED